MALSQKDVFSALLHNHKITLAELCRKAEVSYHKVHKRAANGTILEHGRMEAGRLCTELSVTLDDFVTLLMQASSGKFPDDYPKEQIVLKVVDRALLEERSIVLRVTPDEAAVITIMRGANERAAERAYKIAGKE